MLIDLRFADQAARAGQRTEGNALAVLIKHVKEDELAPAERDAITRLRFQLEEIDKIKAGHRMAKKVSKRCLTATRQG